MLVLGRKLNEQIVLTIGGEVIACITLCAARTHESDGRVRLGIDADQSIGIYRGEIWRAIQRAGGDRRHRTGGDT